MPKSIKNWELQDSIRECVEDVLDDDADGSGSTIWYLDDFLADAWFDVILENRNDIKRVCLHFGKNGENDLILAAVDPIAGIGTICHLFSTIIYKKLGGLKRKD